MLQPNGSPALPHRPAAPWYHRFLSLRWRLAFVYIALFSIFVSVLSIFLYRSTADLLLNSGQMAFPQHVVEIRSQLLHDICDNNTLHQTNAILKQEPADDIDAIYLIDSSGRVTASNNSTLLNQPFPYIDHSFFSSPHPSVSKTFTGIERNGSSFNGLLVPLQAPPNCAVQNKLPPYLAIITSYSNERNTLRNILLLAGTASLLMIILGALVISLLTGVMLRPLQRVTRATQALAAGDLQQRVPIPEGDELGNLAASFNQMAERIEKTLEAYQASERRARRFVSDASHELRTPITSLRGFTEVLMRGAKDDPETAQRVLKLMKGEAERMSRLVGDLLTLARLDEGRVTEMENVDLVDVAIESVRQAKTRANPRCKIMLDMATQERLRVRANPELLKQMLALLLDNAVKYGCLPSNDKVLLRLDRKAHNALISVIDYGKGILPADLPHVFDRFYRGDHSSSAGGTPIIGAGLGLSIAIAIAQAHKGNITACSKPDKETVFTVTLPCLD